MSLYTTTSDPHWILFLQAADPGTAEIPQEVLGRDSAFCCPGLHAASSLVMQDGFLLSEPQVPVSGSHVGSLGPQPPRCLVAGNPVLIKPVAEADSGPSDA